MAGRWEHFEHEADVGIRGIGDSVEDAFEQAAIAMTAVITHPETISPETGVEITCSAPDNELLLADWLNGLIYEMATRNMLFSRFAVVIRDGRLTASAFGERIQGEKHQPAVEVKGATYTALRVTQDATGQWIAQCVLDV